MRRPKCPNCKCSMVKVFYHQQYPKQIGFICIGCNRIKLQENIIVINDDLWIGLQKLKV